MGKSRGKFAFRVQNHRPTCSSSNGKRPELRKQASTGQLSSCFSKCDREIYVSFSLVSFTEKFTSSPLYLYKSFVHDLNLWYLKLPFDFLQSTTLTSKCACDDGCSHPEDAGGSTGLSTGSILLIV